MTFPAGVEAAIYELRAKLGVPASAIHLHFSDDGKLQKIVPEMVFRAHEPAAFTPVKPRAMRA